ncbi:MAG: PucR family transcriptional regulator ligand-binding domain-containing protein [Actinomycetia bacterium]|nr:PucR family transcriptional regulator ligand-binding domain-containing protein [Actinomycetes bacterium]
MTVRQILSLASLKEARLLAGAKGLDRRVTSVTVGEVPDIADWLSGGEMVLSTMFAVKGDLERQREFCRRVMMADAAALFVKTTRFVESIPADIIELADKRRFPIVEVPQGLRWTRLMQDATELIINRQASLLEQSQSIHRSLLGIVIRGGGWQQLADEAARLLGGPLLIIDTSHEILAASTDLSVSPAELRDRLNRAETRRRLAGMGGGQKHFRVEEEGLPAMFVLPIVASHVKLGYVCVFSAASDLTANEVLILEHTATIAALEMAQDRVRFETEVRLKGDFVDDLISGAEHGADSLLRRGAFLGCDLSQGAAVILLGVDEFDGLVSRKGLDQEELDRRVELLFSLCSRLVSSSEASSLVSLKSGRIVIFVCGKSAHDPATLRRLTTALQNLGEAAGGLSISAGIGGFTPEASQMDRAYSEALVALKVGRKLHGPASVLPFDEVGTYRLLLDIWERDPDEIRSLYEETIGPIDRYDEVNGTQLTRTLAVFLRNNENLTKTAAELYAHRHTIRYRLEKVAEISGLSVFETEHKERLGLGLKARSLLMS